jgi:RimJ/RimL family protein N-acetyltransferase
MTGQVADQPIRTERLDLVPVSDEDADQLGELVADERLYAFTGGRPGPALRARFAQLAADRSASVTAQRNWVVRHRVDARATGMLQAVFTEGGRAADLAWVIGVPWQGQGMAVEATGAVVGWLAARGVGTVTAWIRPDHHASAGVARHAGLVPTDEFREGDLHREQLWRLRHPSVPP